VTGRILEADKKLLHNGKSQEWYLARGGDLNQKDTDEEGGVGLPEYIKRLRIPKIMVEKK